MPDPPDRPATDAPWVGLSRRGFLGLVVAGVAAACSTDQDEPGGGGQGTSAEATDPSIAALDPPAVADLDRDPFTLGVASGDPLPSSVILWTRLAPDPLNGGGLPVDSDAQVLWEVAADEEFSELHATGIAAAPAAFGHSVHVDATGLQPDSWYYYRFRVEGFTSPVGRTRTLPSADSSPEELRFAFASCQHWEDGYFTAYGNLVAEDLDFVLFLGDYIYEGGVGETGVRQHEGPEPTTVDGYRNRYALYKSDVALQEAHAAFPWIVTWDDHEVENNYAGDFDQNDSPVEQFLERRAAAYQVFYESMPIRTEAPVGPDLQIYREFVWGDLARFWVLDTRQYRANQACSIIPGVDAGLDCPDIHAPDQLILGEEQELWLLDGLSGSESLWNVLAQQVVVTPTPIEGENLDLEELGELGVTIQNALGEDISELEGFNFDQWDGYPEQRQRLLSALAGTGSPNNVVLTGDIHASAAGPLRALADDPESEIVGAEFVGTSISSAIEDGGFGAILESAYGPNFDYYNKDERGYVRCTVSRDEWVTTYRTVETTLEETSAIGDDAEFALTAGEPGLTRVS
ncbi:MAG: Alkaline phosphatase D [Acidimicrobiales bacterium]|nr:MAG: alkaline phosphatase [Actinomycetota bacterium]MBV6508236.1 Alkaline phosphatase D [Acidimicrobiales bacterium]RIK07309.1 MAG: alkaline phosphatase [Acidobacteriota bacterium]